MNFCRISSPNDRQFTQVRLCGQDGRNRMGQEEHHQSEHHSATPAAFSQGHPHSQLSAGAVRQDLASEAYFCTYRICQKRGLQWPNLPVMNTKIALTVSQCPGGRVSPHVGVSKGAVCNTGTSLHAPSLPIGSS